MKGFDYKRYIIRVIKYMIYIAIIFTLVLAIFALTSGQGLHYENFFRPGTETQLIVFFIAISFVYPLLGFVKKPVYLNKSYEEDKEIIRNVLENARYIVVAESSTTISFRHVSPFIRAMRMFEDTIVIDYSDNPIMISGQRRDIVRMIRAIEYATKKEE